MTRRAAPRIYCITALDAPVAAVFRRGPSEWAHVGRWDLDAGRYAPGAWLQARLFPRRSDLSPDGRLLCYFAHKPGARWAHGDAYVALARLPWLSALHAFATCGTWTRGLRFTRKDEGQIAVEPPLPMPYGLAGVSPEQFATERRRGWEEAPDSPPRRPEDTWDQQRNARLHKRQPGGTRMLRVQSEGHPGGEFGLQQAIDGLRVRYSMEAGGVSTALDDLQWADWDRRGRLLGATRDGRLQIRELEDDAGARHPPGTGEFRIVFDEDLSGLRPDPAPPPDWASRW